MFCSIFFNQSTLMSSGRYDLVKGISYFDINSQVNKNIYNDKQLRFVCYRPQRLNTYMYIELWNDYSGIKPPCIIVLLKSPLLFQDVNSLTSKTGYGFQSSCSGARPTKPSQCLASCYYETNVQFPRKKLYCLLAVFNYKSGNLPGSLFRHKRLQRLSGQTCHGFFFSSGNVERKGE